MDKELFKIGEVAKLFHISISSLRHYESEGLLVPEYTDETTGYRFYSTRQFEVLNTIRYLRALDMPLDEISDFLHDRDVDRIEEKLRQQKAAVEKKQEELRKISRKIDNRLHQLDVAQNSVLDKIELRQYPPCRIFWVRVSLEITNFYDLEMPVANLTRAQSEAAVFIGKVGIGISADSLNKGCFGQYDGIFLVLDDEDSFDGETTFLPETPCVTVRFRGSHPESPEQYRRLMEYIREHELEVAGFSREITMIDYGITNDTDKFVTEINIPVRKKL